MAKRSGQVDLENQPKQKKTRISKEKETAEEGIPESDQQTGGPPNVIISAKESLVREKTLFVFGISFKSTLRDIIGFFSDVGQVVRVRRVVREGEAETGCGFVACAFVEFFSADEAKKALETKNGEHLHGKKRIALALANQGSIYHPPKYCTDHKPWFVRDDTSSPNVDEKEIFVTSLSPQTKKFCDIITFFKDVGQVVGGRLFVDCWGKPVGCALVQFATADQANKALQKKTDKYLHDHMIILMNKYGETPTDVEVVAVREKTLFVGNLPKGIPIPDIITFFKDAGTVTHVRLHVDIRGNPLGKGFVDFAFANQAKKALQQKNGENLLNRNIVLKKAVFPRGPKYSIDHNIRYQQSIPRGLDETAEEVAARKKTLFVANIPTTHDIKLQQLIEFFEDKLVGGRLIVDGEGKRVGCAFVEFRSDNEARKALEENNGQNLHGCTMFLDVAEIGSSYTSLQSSQLLLVWKEDYLRRDRLGSIDSQP